MAAVQKKISCKNLHSYLTHLPSNVLDRLYDHPATCLAVMRQLPVLGRHYVMRVLFVDQPVPQAVVSSWVVNPTSGSEVVKVLSSLRIFNNTVIPGGLPGWILNPKFKENLRVALLGGGSAWAGSGMALGPDKHAKEVSFLDNYAMERWECVLHFMVGSKETTEGVSRDVVEILLYAKLMKPDAGGGPPVISPSGFQFLLMDSSTQIWFFMLQYLETVERRGMNLVECLSFLFQLSFSTFGNDYCTDGMSDTQFKFLQNLREFGLVYQRKRKSHRYYPTRLAINLASGMSQMSTESARPGYIVVETNYRIYSYTDSPLQVALIALFSEMLYRFPNMCVSNLTRESVRQALVMGITAEQIINFLRSHAHPQQLKQTPVLPPTITDQIRLWELERDRFRFNDGVLYNQFNSVQDYELLRDYAQDQGVLVWGNVNRRAMVVMKNGHDDVKKFWKRHRPQS